MTEPRQPEFHEGEPEPGAENPDHTGAGAGEWRPAGDQGQPGGTDEQIHGGPGGEAGHVEDAEPAGVGLGEETTRLAGLGAAAAPVLPAPIPAGPTDSIFRQPSPTPSPEPAPPALSEEEQKLAAERAARREARAAALAAAAPPPPPAPEPVVIKYRTTDGFWGSAGLFIVRLALAAIFAVRGLNLLLDLPAAQAMFAKTVLPEAPIMAIVTGVAAVLIAFALILGLATRAAGLGVALIGAGALTFFLWGNWSLLVPGQPGFIGDFELLVTGVGLLLMTVGAGGWSVDRSIRASRDRDRREREAGLR